MEPRYIGPLNGGTQEVYRFNNGYGASLIYGGTYARGREIAVLKFYGTGNFDYEIDYDTPITTDVIGYLTEDEVALTLAEIERLPAPIEAVPETIQGTIERMDDE